MLKSEVVNKKKVFILEKFIDEIFTHKLVYLILFVILFFAFFLRIYRITDLLGFYYDQGRDAQVIWELIKNRELFLIGPTTGLAGVFRGPYYYYLIAPSYLIGNGNPIFPSVFLSLTSVLAILFGYYLGFKFQNRATGIIFAVLSSCSFYIVIASRWLSNPTPMLLLSLVLVFAMDKVTRRKKWGWPIIGLVSGLSLFNFGSSGELFYFVSLTIFFVWQWKNRPNLKTLILTIFLFVLTFAPLVLFDLKHDGILRTGFAQNFGQEKSFTLPTQTLFGSRNEVYLKIFPKMLFHSIGKYEKILLTIIGIVFLFSLPQFVKNKGIKILLLLLFCVLTGLYFYQGNQGTLYEYYLTGYFLIFLLLVAVVLGVIWDYKPNNLIFGQIINKIGKLFVLVFLFLFLKNNYEPLNFILTGKSDAAESIAFVNQKAAIDWIYKDAMGRPFNVDVYVPPVIPYAYDYLFTWLGTTKYGYLPNNNQIELLYTLYEVDPPHPERLDAWLERQKGIGKVNETYKNGGITVERRERLK